MPEKKLIQITGRIILHNSHIIIVAFGIYPLIFTLRLSFTNWRGSGAAEWVGLDNYLFLLQNSGFWSSLGNSTIALPWSSKS